MGSPGLGPRGPIFDGVCIFRTSRSKTSTYPGGVSIRIYFVTLNPVILETMDGTVKENQTRSVHSIRQFVGTSVRSMRRFGRFEIFVDSIDSSMCRLDRFVDSWPRLVRSIPRFVHSSIQSIHRLDRFVDASSRPFDRFVGSSIRRFHQFC